MNELPKAKWYGPSQASCRVEQLKTPGVVARRNSLHDWIEEHEQSKTHDKTAALIDLEALLEQE